MLHTIARLLCRLRYGAFTAQELSAAALNALGRGDRPRYELLKNVCVTVYGAQAYVTHGRAYVIQTQGKDPYTGQVIEAESYAVH